MRIEDYACRQFLTNEMIPRFEPITKFLYPKETYSSLYKIDDFLGWFTPEMCDFIIRFSVKLLKKKPKKTTPKKEDDISIEDIPF